MCVHTHSCSHVLQSTDPCKWHYMRPLHLADRKQLYQRRAPRAEHRTICSSGPFRNLRIVHTAIQTLACAQSGRALEPFSHKNRTVHSGSTMDVSHHFHLFLSSGSHEASVIQGNAHTYTIRGCQIHETWQVSSRKNLNVHIHILVMGNRVIHKNTTNVPFPLKEDGNQSMTSKI